MVQNKIRSLAYCVLTLVLAASQPAISMNPQLDCWRLFQGSEIKTDEDWEAVWYQLFSADDVIHLSLPARQVITTERVRRIRSGNSILSEENRSRLRARKQEQFKKIGPIFNSYLEILDASESLLPNLLEREFEQQRLSTYPEELPRAFPTQRVHKAVTESFLNPIPPMDLDEPSEQVLDLLGGGYSKQRKYYITRVAAWSKYSRLFFWREPSENEDHSNFTYLMGAYGEGSFETYKNMSLAMGLMMGVLHDSRERLSSQMKSVNDDELGFARKMFPIEEETGIQNPTFRAMEEGLLSFYQLLLFLSSGNIDGLTTDQIVRKLLEPGPNGATPISLFTKMLPMGILGPSHMFGVLPVRPLTLNSRKKLVPTRDLTELFDGVQDNNTRQVERQGLDQEISTLGCPMTLRCGEESPIDQLAKRYLFIYDYIQNRENQ